MRSLPRREFLSISVASSVLVLADTLRTRPTARAVADSLDWLSPARPDIVATYRAAPTEIDLAGTVVSTWAYNDMVPGPLLRATAGDVVEVKVDNAFDEATSIHWHGLAIVNSMDGVPGLTQADIDPRTQFTYRFAVPDSGTYWFHPHHGLQLDHGLYAPLIIDGRDDDVDVHVEYVIVLDDWLDGLGTTPEQELERIRDMGAAMGGPGHDMGDMEMATSPLLGGDAGDAVYPFHLVNGSPIDDPVTLDPQPRGGDRLRLRFVNAGGDTAYRVAIGGHRMTVTHTDGFAIVPFEVDAFVIGMGERYDVTIDIRSGVWPLVALAEGKQARAAAVIRTRDAGASPTPDLTADIDELDGVWLRYADLRAAEDVALTPPDVVDTRLITLTGGMVGFDWGFRWPAVRRS